MMGFDNHSNVTRKSRYKLSYVISCQLYVQYHLYFLSRDDILLFVYRKFLPAENFSNSLHTNELKSYDYLLLLTLVKYSGGRLYDYLLRNNTSVCLIHMKIGIK